MNFQPLQTYQCSLVLDFMSLHCKVSTDNFCSLLPVDLLNQNPILQLSIAAAPPHLMQKY